MGKEVKIKNINIHFWIIFNIAICAVLIDYLVYIANIKYSIALAISGITSIIGNFALIKNKIISIKTDFEWYDLFFIFIWVNNLVLNIAIPDFKFDTNNYHIYLQSNIKIDKVNFDYFAACNINGFLFALGDRMHYIFRYLLGYRLGTILSHYSIIVIFYQTKKMLNHLCGKSKINAILAISCFSSFLVRIWTGTYYIDTLSVVFTLEIICFILKEKECFENKIQIIYLAIITGILTAIKLPNLLLITPVYFFFLIKRRKQLKLSNIWVYALSSVIFVIPFLIYIIDNIIQTGSPLFPYYNNIFKSEYFGFYSWVEPRFGIPNLMYKIIWPIYVSLSKIKYGDGAHFIDPIWAVGYLTVLAYIVYGIIRWKKRSKDLFDISILAIILTIIWIQLLYGYMRYALIIPVVYCIIISSIVNIVLKFLKNKFFKNLSFGRFSIFIIFYIFILLVTLENKLMIADNGWNTIKENYQYILRDRNIQTIHIDGVWGVVGWNTGLTQMVREENVPIYNLEKGLYDSSSKALEQYDNLIKNNDDIYILVIDDYRCAERLRCLYDQHFDLELIKVFSVDDISYINSNNKIYLYKIRK